MAGNNISRSDIILIYVNFCNASLKKSLTDRYYELIEDPEFFRIRSTCKYSNPPPAAKMVIIKLLVKDVALSGPFYMFSYANNHP